MARVIDDIKKQEDELIALKSTQVIAGSQLPIFKTSSGTQSGSIDVRGDWEFTRNITFRTTAGYHFLDFSLDNFAQTSGNGEIRIGEMCVHQLPQDGSGVIQLKLFIRVGTYRSYPPPSTYVAGFTYSITAFGDATGTFSIS